MGKLHPVPTFGSIAPADIGRQCDSTANWWSHIYILKKMVVMSF